MPYIAARPGFDAVYKVIYNNKGNQTLSGSVKFSFDDGILDYVSSVPNTSDIAVGLLSYDYLNLLPFEHREIFLTLHLNGPTDTPAVNVGNILSFSATVFPVLEDETLGDNTFNFRQTVVSSLDPNEKNLP